MIILRCSYRHLNIYLEGVYQNTLFVLVHLELNLDQKTKSQIELEENSSVLTFNVIADQGHHRIAYYHSSLIGTR